VQFAFDLRRRFSRCALAQATRVLVASVSLVATAQAEEVAHLQQLAKAAQAEGSVMIYHTSPPPIIGSTFRAFEQKHGIKVFNYHATGNPLTVRFSSEAAAGKPVADVFYASDTTTFSEFPNLFQKLTPENFPNYPHLPDVARLDSGLAVSPSQTSFSMFYNTKRISRDEAPRRWLDLVDPKWKGSAMLVDPRSSATYRAAFNAIRQIHPHLLSAIRAIEPRLVESGTPAVQQLAAGTARFAFMGYPSHAAPIMSKGAPVQWATIEGPELTRGVWVGAARGPHPNAARLFVNFFASEEALRLYCKASDGSKSAIDRLGTRTGCEPLAQDVLFLSDAPLSREDSATVLRELGLQ
jgi:iron(III) transport system substrate-binding protein